MKLLRLITLVAFLFIGLASPTTASGNEGGEVDKEEEEAAAAARAEAEHEDELSNLWRRFLLNECWRKEPTATQMMFEFRHAGDILRPEDMSYGTLEDAKHWEGYKEHSHIPTSPKARIWGNAWDCECGGLRQWIWDYWPEGGFPTTHIEEDPGALNASYQVEDEHFRAAIADPAVDWRNFTREWHVFYKWRKLRRGYFTIPLLQTEHCQYPPRFNESEV
ncbi:hypothetical protein KJ359_004882 [Pestalotiopsis sp. 9143b]|nr:hypothetical protein KJ359_004882 [Pestalotiopsis sp. 9143b]